MPATSPTRPPWAAHLPAGCRPDDVDLLAGGNLTAGWVARWESDPARPVLHTEASGWVAGGPLAEATAAVAGRLAAAGLTAGDRVLVSAAPSLDLVVAHVAALRAGLVVVPVSTAYSRLELGHVLADARPAAALVDSAARGRWVSDALPHAVVTHPSVPLPDATPPPLDVAEPDDPALLVHTSGTTGRSKGAVLSHANLLASAAAVGLAWRWTPEDRLVLSLPMFHLHGLGVGLHGSLAAGASIVLRPGFDAGDVFDVTARHHGSLFFGVPTMYHRLAASGRLDELSALRLCVSGSAPLPASLHREIARRAGMQILERYGMTETVMNVSNPYDGERRPGTVGLPLPGVEVRLEEGTDEISVRGPNVFAGYWERPDADAEAFSADWFHTGDVGAFDPDGYLSIVGRRKELIITGGYNVHPREVEDALRGHPGVVDVAVVGVPDQEWGEVVVAFVVGDAPPQQLAAAAGERLAPYKRPRRYHDVEELPRNALGKVVRDQLREPGAGA